ncbi:hypothetical protein HanXRQr2_Chr17g0829681 [Helianthus annuus]|uniref:Uncharacterized protein n=1 Tax=Helianthus annuus TaxID=4232 RepID=A0A251RW90_HELAN|nr:hypothetical protein HanXRQr2_Chr17g0829681 [Helianthus annuus]
MPSTCPIGIMEEPHQPPKYWMNDLIFVTSIRFFGIHVSSTALDLAYIELIVASGTVCIEDDDCCVIISRRMNKMGC